MSIPYQRLSYRLHQGLSHRLQQHLSHRPHQHLSSLASTPSSSSRSTPSSPWNTDKCQSLGLMISRYLYLYISRRFFTSWIFYLALPLFIILTALPRRSQFCNSCIPVLTCINSSFAVNLSYSTKNIQNILEPRFLQDSFVFTGTTMVGQILWELRVTATAGIGMASFFLRKKSWFDFEGGKRDVWWQRHSYAR